MCFYDNLSELCKINGITVSGLLAELKMSASNKQKWQNGATVNSSVLMKIADYFNVSVDYLVGLSDIPTPANSSHVLPLPSNFPSDLLPELKDYADFLSFKATLHTKNKNSTSPDSKKKE